MGKIKTNIITKQINELLESTINIHIETGKKFDVVIPIIVNNQELAKYKYSISDGTIKWEKVGNFSDT